MTKYIDQERARYWPVSTELITQYNNYDDGTHTGKYDGISYWRNENGQYHRDGDLPAWIGGDGTLVWYQNGLRHRDDDKPAIIWADGSLEWWQNGLFHRDGDKPAQIYADGRLIWCQNGQYHRLHGPAVIRPNGRLEWLINGKNITEEVTEWLNGEEWRGTPEQIFEFKLRFI